ncbi:hypothetical protein, partial [Luteirhabdus pelagi]|uniref:hypothetical protein n=1 Tax=Luteirhabdus pelagi TaxID=2792783 RepID=UPI001F20D3BB
VGNNIFKQLTNILAMQKYVLLLTVVIITITSAFSQENSIVHQLLEGCEIEDSDYLPSGNFYLLETVKNNYRYTVYDDNLNLLNQYSSGTKFGKSDLDFVSTTGKNSIIEEDDQFFLINSESKNFAEEDIDGEISNRFFYNNIDKRIDVVKIKFLTDEKFVSISRKKGKENYKDGKYRDIEIYLFKKNLETLEERYFKLEFPDKMYFYSTGPKILYFDEENFILSYIAKTDDKSRTYINALYDYEGKIIKSTETSIQVQDPEHEFAVVNYAGSSFSAYRSPNGMTANPYDQNILAYQLPTTDSKGAISFDQYDRAYYVYAGVATKGDSGLLISKFDMNGNIVWERYHILEDTKLKYLNSFNRFLRLDTSAKFVGVTVFSRKGKDYCDFYLFDKSSGDLIKNKNFRDYSFYKRSRKYNRLYSLFEIKNKDMENLIVDRITLLSSIYDESYMDYLKKLNSSGSELLVSYFTPDGVNTVRSPKKDFKLTFDKFNF